MPAQPFVDALNEQIGREFGAAQQYLAVALYYDNQTLPQLAAFFYTQSREERGHALMMAQYLLDSEIEPEIPAIGAPRGGFADIVEPVRLALDQERAVTDQISALVAIAREQNDFVSEQFMQWFLKEQVEEVATMSSLLEVTERSRDRPMEVEQYLAREGARPGEADPTAPAVAGGAA
jgi:bacterioferritin B